MLSRNPDGHSCSPITEFEDCEQSVIDGVDERQRDAPQAPCDLRRTKLRVLNAINGGKLMSVRPVAKGDNDVHGYRLDLCATVALLAQFADPLINSPFSPVYEKN